MDMPASGLGKKLKEARLAKKMTQAEVVGNFITRNMLSQIESGAAMPSVKTLSYLAGVLDIPLSELMGDGEGHDEALDSFQILQNAKKCLRAGDYDGVLILCETMPDIIRDELSALGARACLGLARAMIEKDALADVTRLMRQAIQYAGQGLYANEALAAECALLLNQQATRLGQYYLSLAAPELPDAQKTAAPADTLEAAALEKGI